MLVTFGLDEAGRGALAGPMFAAAASHSIPITQIEKTANAPVRDSKKLTAAQRLRLFNFITSSPHIHIFTAQISVQAINQKGIGWANKQIFLDLIDQILNHQKETEGRRPTAERLKIIIDGNLKVDSRQNPGVINPGVEFSIECIPKADALHPQVSLASIVAKVTRDQLMHKLHTKHPHYSWNSNVGYGTRDHINGLRSHGPCQHHRRQFVETALRKSKSKNLISK